MITNKGNNILVLLAAPIVSGDTSLTFSLATGVENDPVNPDGGTSFLTLVDNLNNPTKLEIVAYGTLGAGTISNMTRGQQGTTAVDWSSGSFIYQGLTHLELDKNTVHPNTVSYNSKIPDASNTIMLGPITIDTGITLTIGDNSKVMIQ